MATKSRSPRSSRPVLSPAAKEAQALALYAERRTLRDETLALHDALDGGLVDPATGKAPYAVIERLDAIYVREEAIRDELEALYPSSR